MQATSKALTQNPQSELIISRPHMYILDVEHSSLVT